MRTLAKKFRSAKVRFFVQKFYLRTFALSKVRKFGIRTFRQTKIFALKSSICELWPKNFRSAKVRFFVQQFYLRTFALSQSAKVRKKNFWSKFFSYGSKFAKVRSFPPPLRPFSIPGCLLTRSWDLFQRKSHQGTQNHRTGIQVRSVQVRSVQVRVPGIPHRRGRHRWLSSGIK